MADAPAAPRLVILADDLIWSDRLVRAARAAGATVVAVGSVAGLEAALADADAAIVDLTARAYDGVEAVRRASAGGVRALAIGQHDDHELRRRALAAGAERVLAYRKLAEDGPATIARWLAGPVTASR